MTAIKYKENGEWKTLTMPSAVHIGTAAPDEDVKQLWVDTYAVTPPYGYVPPLVTALPTAPFDGQEVRYLADVNNGSIWTLRYRQASLSAYKWEFVGGTALWDTVTANQGTVSTAFVDLATIGPQVPLALSGDYLVEWGADGTEYATAQYMALGLWNGSAWTQFSSNANTLYSQANQSAGGTRGTRSKATRLNAVPGAVTNSIRARYAVSAATNLGWSDRWLKVTPIRVAAS